jgi:hypothetical protein
MQHCDNCGRSTSDTVELADGTRLPFCEDCQNAKDAKEEREARRDLGTL